MTTAALKELVGILLFGMALLYFLIGVVSLRTGKTRSFTKYGGGCVYERKTAPQFFWFHVISHFVLGLLSLCGAIILAIV
jgi:hypothetical protein